VRAEVDRQIRLVGLRDMKCSVEQAVASVQGTIDRTVRQHAGELQVGVDAAAVSLNEAV
jgi:sec-independent protein translocase protein TatB